MRNRVPILAQSRECGGGRPTPIAHRKERLVIRRTLCLAVLLVAMPPGHDAVAGEFSYGAKVGMTLANITQTPAEWEQDNSYKAGFTGGLFLNYAVTDHFSLQPEILYTQKGVNDKLYDGFITVDITAYFDYIELPALAKYTFMPDAKFRPNIFGGPCVAFTILSELEVTALLLSGRIDFTDLTHVTDFGLVAGGGFDYSIGKGMIVCDARFHVGFTNVILSGDFLIDGSTQTIDEDDFKNYGFSLMVGYGF
jgi:hypothetical protein